MEDGVVSISRVTASLTYPSEFLLVASMNPCPCGYYGDETHVCTCSMQEIQRYAGKISNPILDRIDIHIMVKPVKYDELTQDENAETSKTIRKRVNDARQRQIARYKGTGVRNNAQLTNRLIKKHIQLSASAQKIVEMAFHQYKFSARSFQKILKLSRTIADLYGADLVEDKHVLEAVRYRSPDTMNQVTR